MAFTVIETLGMINKHCTELEKLITDVPNTHKGIKEVVARLSRQKEVLNQQSIKKWLEDNSYEQIEKLSFDVDVQTEKRKTAEVETQTPWNLIECDSISTIEGIDNLEKWNTVQDKTWDAKIFKNSDIVVENPLNTNEEVKTVIVESEDTNMDQGIQRLYKEMYPELEHLENEFEVLQQLTKIGSCRSTTGVGARTDSVADIVRRGFETRITGRSESHRICRRSSHHCQSKG